MKGEMVAIEAGDDGRRLDRWLRERYPQLNQGRIEKLLRKGDIRVDGGKVKSNFRLAEWMTVTIPPVSDDPGAPTRGGKPTISEADTRLIRNMVMYEDDHVIVLNKPAGIPVQGGTGQSNRHIDGLLPALAGDGDRPKLVHRIDKDTSGLLLLARTGLAARNLTAAFRSKAARKTYWAAVIGVPKPREGTIKAAIMKSPGTFGEKMTVINREDLPNQPDAKRAVTDYATMDTAAQLAAWLTLRPITGRTHQLRVHCSTMGHPIVGDGKYGPTAEEAERRLTGAVSRKMHLHARHIVIPHPEKGQPPIDIRAPLPEHMAHSWDLFGWDKKRTDDDEFLSDWTE